MSEGGGTSRRDLLRGLACVGTTMTAGCSGLFGNGNTPPDPAEGDQTPQGTPTVGTPSISGRVSQLQYNAARTGARDGRAPEPPIRDAWRYEYERGGYGQPVVSNGMVFFGLLTPDEPSRMTLYALDAATGTEQWRQGFDRFKWSLLVGEQRLYYMNRGKVVARTLDSEPLWTFTSDDHMIPSEFVLGDDTVYAGGTNLYAIDRYTGALEWRAPGYQVSKASGLAVAEGRVYAGRVDGYLYTLDAATGEHHWWYRPGAASQLTPAVHDGTVYGANTKGQIYAVDAETGKERWRNTIQNELTGRSSLAVTDGLVVANDKAGTIYGFNARDGSERWRQETEDSFRNPPIIVGDTVLVVGYDQIRAFAPDGTVRWTAPIFGDQKGAAIAVDGYLFVPGGNGLYCFG